MGLKEGSALYRRVLPFGWDHPFPRTGGAPMAPSGTCALSRRKTSAFIERLLPRPPHCADLLLEAYPGVAAGRSSVDRRRESGARIPCIAREAQRHSWADRQSRGPDDTRETESSLEEGRYVPRALLSSRRIRSRTSDRCPLARRALGRSIHALELRHVGTDHTTVEANDALRSHLLLQPRRSHGLLLLRLPQRDA